MLLHKRLRSKIALILSILAILLITALILNNAAKSMFPTKFSAYVFKYSEQFELDPYLVFAVIKAESSFNPKAVSHKNAMGLMQITETTAEWGSRSLKLKNFSKDMLFDPETNIQIGCWYLRRLMQEFDNDTDLVIAAYNGGSGNVSGWLKDRSYSNTGKSLKKIPCKETERFLKKVKNFWYIYKKLYEKPV
jgi:soluble lytic murein transglycosylase